jgi:hypothetical protein
MAKVTVKLPSSGEKIKVRTLGVFELDTFDPDPIGMFTFAGQTLAGEVEIEYDGSGWDAPPKKPDVIDPEEGTDEWRDLREWELYHAWVLHEERRYAAAAEYHQRIAEYILSNCLNGQGDRGKVVTAEDWEVVHQAAFVPQLTEEDVAAALRTTFPGLI